MNTPSSLPESLEPVKKILQQQMNLVQRSLNSYFEELRADQQLQRLKDSPRRPYSTVWIP